MWFGTLDGLNKYDGYRFTTYRHDPQNPNSLSDNAIWAIHEDRSGLLWLATNAGLNRFDPRSEKFTAYRHDPDNPHSLSHDAIWAIYADRAGRLWIGTDGGLNRFDPASGTFTVFRHSLDNRNSLSDDRVLAIHEDRQGMLWLGTWDGGLNQFDPATNSFTAFRHAPDDPNSLSDDRVLAIHEDRQGRLWLGTWDGGLNKFDPTTQTFTIFHHSPDDPATVGGDDIRAILEDRYGALWIGSWDGGLSKFDPATQTFTVFRNNPDDPQSIRSNRVRTLFEDRGGVLWVGTWGGGLSRLQRPTKLFAHYQHVPDQPNTLSDSDVRAVLVDQAGLLWVGTAGGLNQLNTTTGAVIHFRHDPNRPGSLNDNHVNALYQDRAGTLWVGTNRGLNKLNAATQTFTVYEPAPYAPKNLSHAQVSVIYEDSHGVLWVGTNGGGLNRFDRKTETFTHFGHDVYEPGSLSNDFVRAIYEDSSDVLWVGTNGGGLNRFDRATESFVHLAHDSDIPGSLSHNQVNVIYQDHGGALWVGTGGGLNRYDAATQTFTHYTEQDGLPSQIIQGILEDDGELPNLWISTEQGLARLSLATDTLQSYGLQDGLPGSAFNRGSHFKSQRNELFFGGLAGLITFHPDQIQNNPHRPPVVITAVRTNNPRFNLPQAASFLQQIELSYWEPIVSFEFASLDYVAPDENQYAYRLEGFDQNWIKTDAQQRTATYANLKPGHYTFRVKGSNNDGVWNEEGASVNLIIHPPPWQTWWAYSLYVLALGIAVFAVVQLKTRAQARELARQREINELLENEVAARTRRLELVAALSERLNAILDIDQLLMECVNQVKERLGYYHAQVFMLDETHDNLILRASAGKASQAVAKNELHTIPLTTPNSLLAHAARTGEIIIAENVFEAANWMPDPLRPDTKSEIGVPIMVQEQVVGVLDVQEDEFAALDDSDAHLLRSLANQVSVAIENARLYSVAQRELAERGKLIAELDAFAYTVAHDFQNPLSSIIAYAELLGEEWSTRDDLQEASEVIARNGHKLKAIVRELLLLAKMRNSDAARQPLDMAKIVEEAQQNLRLMIDDGQAEIIVPAEWPAALGYAPWVEEVWTNYLSNAIKYGGRPPRVELGATTLDNGMVRFWVRDNGEGLSPDDQAKLFLPFVQLSRSRVEGGYGLGLSIVQRIVEKLGGQVSVESSGISGQGSLFSFTLPAAS
jgi:ligand-binding sensor domain-containing protein/signal transduction histidine kinase